MTEIAPDRTPHHIRTAWILGLAGLIPFIGCALGFWILEAKGEAIKGYQAFGFLYGVIILSFLGGIRWGLAISPLHSGNRSLDLGVSVLPSIYGWAVFGICAVMNNLSSGLPWLAGGFGLMLFWDFASQKKGHFPSWFMPLRITLSLGAIVSLLALIG